LLNESGLKEWLHRDLKQLDKLLLILATFNSPTNVTALRERAASAGLKINDRWNPSSTLSRSRGLAIKVPAGWELTESGKAYLRNLGVTSLSPAAVQVASDLRAHLAKIQNPATHAFVEEAIKCYEAQLYRSAIVMSWLAAVDVLHRVVVAQHLADFNSEAKKCNSNWKTAVNEDGVGRMPENDFLDRLAGINVLGKNQKAELKKALDLRNGCGHPNSLKVGPNVVAAHLELLLLNVFEKFDA
jgi:hypothetical protein